MIAFLIRHRIGLILFFVALAVRLAGVTFRGEWRAARDQFPDEMIVQADMVAHGQGFCSVDDPNHSPSTQFPPGYVVFLAACMKVAMGLGYAAVPIPAGLYAGLVLLNGVVSSLVAPLAVAIGRGLGWSGRAAALAGAAVCFCPEAVRATGMVWDEAFLATACAGMVGLLVRLLGLPQLRWWHSVLLGALSGVLALLNPAFLPATLGAWVVGNFVRDRGPVVRRFGIVAAHGFVLVVLTVAAGLPWHARNWFLLDPPQRVFVRGGLGKEIWLGVHPLTFVDEGGKSKAMPFGAHWGTDPMVKDGRALTEQEYFAWSGERATAWVRENPGEYASHVLKQVESFWLGIDEALRWRKPWYKFFVPQGVPALVGLAGLWMARRRMPGAQWWALAAILALFPVVYYLTNAAMRYRHPVDVVLYLGVGYAGEQAWRFFSWRNAGRGTGTAV